MDEISLHIVSVPFGSGIRLFDDCGWHISLGPLLGLAVSRSATQVRYHPAPGLTMGLQAPDRSTAIDDINTLQSGAGDMRGMILRGLRVMQVICAAQATQGGR